MLERGLEEKPVLEGMLERSEDCEDRWQKILLS